MSYRYHERLAEALDALGWTTEGGSDGSACAGRRQVAVRGACGWGGWSVIATWVDSTRIRVDVFVPEKGHVAEVEVHRNPGRGWARRVANSASEELERFAPGVRSADVEARPGVVHCGDCSQPYWPSAPHTCPRPKPLADISGDDPIPF